MLYEKALDRMCPECGEDMQISRDYGLRGEALSCSCCGFSEEVIDLRETVLGLTSAA